MPLQSRRAILGALAAAPVAGLPAIAAAAESVADPIFTALDALRRAQAADARAHLG